MEWGNYPIAVHTIAFKPLWDLRFQGHDLYFFRLHDVMASYTLSIWTNPLRTWLLRY